MGLRINHISASDGRVSGNHVNALHISGAAYFDPSGAAVAKAEDAVAGFDAHGDAAYIFSGTVGGGDKALFLGDVVVSGSLSLGSGGTFLDGAGAEDAVGVYSDSNTISYGALYFSSGSHQGDHLKIGENDRQSHIYLGSGSLDLHHKGEEGGTVSGIYADAMSLKIGVTSSLGGVEIAGMMSVLSGTQMSKVVTSDGGISELSNLGGDLYVRVSPNGNASGERITLKNTAGTPVDAIIVDAVAGGIDIDATKEIHMSGSAVSAISGEGVLTLQSVGDKIDVDSASAFEVDAGTGISLDAGGASNFTTLDGALTLVGAAGEAVGTAGQTTALAGSLTVAEDVTITGDLTVNGDTTTVSTTNMVVEDSLIELSNGASSATNDAGIVIERGATGDNAIFMWDESADNFTLGTTTATGASTGNLTVTVGTLVATASNVSVHDSNDNTAFPVVFHNESNELLDDTGGLTYNPNTGDLSVPGDLDLLSDAAILNFGADKDVNLTHVADTGLLLNSSRKLQFGDADTYIQQSADAELKLQSDDVIILSSSLVQFSTDNVELAFGADEATTLTHRDGHGLVMTGSEAKFGFGFQGGPEFDQMIRSNAAGTLNLDASSKIDFHINDDTTPVLSIGESALTPDGDNAYDLGSGSKRFANIYTGDLNLRNDRGDWTLIEENDFISFRNNKTGRRFRMVMEDITGTGTYGPGNDGEM